VVLDRTDAAAVGHTDDDGDGEAPARPVVHLGELGGDLVEGREDEAVELDLADRAVAAHGKADRATDDAGLGERGVENALLAELRLQPLGHTEHATEATDVLTHEENLRVIGERLLEPQVEGLRHAQGFDPCSFVAHWPASSKDASYRSSHAAGSSISECCSE
jgi:hypothetical protein